MIALLLSMMSLTNDPPKLIYVGDPMCSWCYGVAPELEKVKKAYDGQLEFEVVLGGLRPYNTETMTDLSDFLHEHWEEVNAMSGQPFKYDILKRSDITYDTEPPCRATVVVRQLKPEATFSFFKAIQKDFYLNNKNMHLAESYFDALKTHDINQDQFVKMFDSMELKKAVQGDFKRAEKMGVRGFPTLLLEVNGRIKLISNGYATADEMKAKIDRLLK